MYQFTNTMKNAQGQTLSPVLFNDPMHIRFDLSAGGWADDTSQPPAAGTFQVDYVRAWQEAAPTPTPTPTTTPTPTPAPVAGDVNGDGHVTSLDLAILLTNWNAQSGASRATGDLNGDGKVTALDLAILLSGWGK
jgi:hypothetical protein